MKTMIVADFATLRSALVQLVGICLVVALFMGLAMETVGGPAAAIVAMVPFMMLFSLAAADEQNGWERFRLTLPLTRRQVVCGRYASLALIILATVAFVAALSFVFLAVASALPAGALPAGLTPAENPPAVIVGSIMGSACVVMVGASATLPLIMRFGMTRATRIAPVVVVLALAAAVALFDNSALIGNGALADVSSWIGSGDNYLIALLALAAVAALFYLVSAFIAAKLYEQREF